MNISESSNPGPGISGGPYPRRGRINNRSPHPLRWRCGGVPVGWRMRLTRTTRQANHAPSPSEWGMRVGAAYTQTGVLNTENQKGTSAH